MGISSAIVNGPERFVESGGYPSCIYSRSLLDNLSVKDLAHQVQSCQHRRARGSLGIPLPIARYR